MSGVGSGREGSFAVFYLLPAEKEYKKIENENLPVARPDLQ